MNREREAQMYKDCEGIPYAYDEENNDVFFAHQCEKCGTIMYTKE